MDYFSKDGQASLTQSAHSRVTHLLIYFPQFLLTDASTTASQAVLADSVFGNAGDPINVTERYNSCSHGKLTFNAATGSGITNGVTEVTVAVATSGGDEAMVNAVTAALNSNFNVSDPSQIADNIMYCLPPGTMSGIAYAFFNR